MGFFIDSDLGGDFQPNDFIQVGPLLGGGREGIQKTRDPEFPDFRSASSGFLKLRPKTVESAGMFSGPCANCPQCCFCPLVSGLWNKIWLPLSECIIIC